MIDNRLPSFEAVLNSDGDVEITCNLPEIKTIPVGPVSNYTDIRSENLSSQYKQVRGQTPVMLIRDRNCANNVPVGAGEFFFNSEAQSNANLVSSDLKKSIISIIESIPPDSLELIIMFFKQFMLIKINSEVLHQESSKSEINTIYEVCSLISKALGLKSMQCRSNYDINHNDFKKIVWKKILEFEKDVFQKVELTKSLQKKLTAGDIDIALQQLIDEGGVIERVEPLQPKSVGGRTPSPYYRLLWKHPKYQKTGTD